MDNLRLTQFFHLLLDQGYGVTLLLNRAERITYCARSMQEVLGFQPALLIGSEFLALVHELERHAFRTALAQFSERPLTVIGRLQHATGAWRWVESSLRACIDPAGTPVHAVTFRDVTDAHESEATRWADQRMSTLGHMATSVAHDFNNLLHALTLHIDVIEHDGSARLRDATHQMRSMLDSAAQLTQHLLAFVRNDHAAPSAAVDVHAVIADTGALIKTLVRRPVRTVYTLDARETRVNIGRTPLSQLLINLAVNARDAMPRGGLLTIATRNTPHHELPDSGGRRHDWLTLEVADLGSGMTPEVKARMFEPFFSTKPRGQGTGIGLHTVMEIVKRSGGVIDVESTRGHGTTIRVHLPLSAAVDGGEDIK